MQSSLAVDEVRQIAFADFFLPALTLGGPRGDRLDTRDSFGTLVEHKENQGLETERIAFAAYRQFKLRPVDDYRVGLSYQLERKLPEQAAYSIARALAPIGEATWRWVDELIDPKTRRRAEGAPRRGRAQRALDAGLRAGLRALPALDPARRERPGDRARGGRDTPSPIRAREFPRTSSSVPAARARTAATPTRAWARATATRWWAGASCSPARSSTCTGSRRRSERAVFHDLGDAADERKALNGNPTYGIGARLRTLAGPLALDLAYAENPRKFRVVFSVSVAF